MGRGPSDVAATDHPPEPEHEPREPERDESPKEKRDRELIELLNELRVALPGVQVLFAFLLTVPFSQGFTKLNDTQIGVFFGTFVVTALATAMLMTPSAYHRVRFRQADKERLLRIANVAALAGLADVLFNALAAWTVALIMSGGYGVLWFLLPLWRRLREAVDDPAAAE
jgi:hypothetical protein